MDEGEKIQKALKIAQEYGDTAGASHKQWVIDQMVRALTGKEYKKFIKQCKAGEDGPDTYDWSTGIAPWYRFKREASASLSFLSSDILYVYIIEIDNETNYNIYKEDYYVYW